jgi:Tol biopolymer transport system component
MAAALPLDERHKFTDLTARDALSALRRYEGLMVYVVSEQKRYHLKGGITNAHWEEIGAAGSGSAAFDDALAATTFFEASDGSKHALWDGNPIGKYANLTPGGNVVSTEISPNGKMLAVTHASSPYLSLYVIDYDTGTFNKIPNPGTLLSTIGAMRFSPDGKCLVVALTASPWIASYNINYESCTITYVGGATGSSGISGASGQNYSLAITNDNSTIALGVFTVSSGATVKAFNLNTTTGVTSYRGNISSSTNQCYAIAINPVDNTLAVHDNSPSTGAIRFYSYDTGTQNFTYSFNDIFPPSATQNMKWSPDGTKLAIAYTTGFGILVLKNVDTTLQTYGSLTNSGANVAFQKVGLAWHPSGEYFVCTNGGVSGTAINLYRISGTAPGTTCTNEGNIYPAPASNDGRGAAFTPNGKILVAGQASVAYFQVWRTGNAPPITQLLMGG